jgi:hypothetical protein
MFANANSGFPIDYQHRLGRFDFSTEKFLGRATRSTKSTILFDKKLSMHFYYQRLRFEHLGPSLVIFDD